MTRAARYFARAEFAIDWPIQFLVGVTGVLLTFFEGSLALWSLFYGAAIRSIMLYVVYIYMSHHYNPGGRGGTAEGSLS